MKQNEQNEGQDHSSAQQQHPAPQSIIWTRRNIVLFIVVVVQGAIILAYMIFVALLFFSPELRQRVVPPDSGAMVIDLALLPLWLFGGYYG